MARDLSERARRWTATVAAAAAVAALVVSPGSPASALDGRVEMTPALQSQIQSMIHQYVTAGPTPIVGFSAAVVTPSPTGAEPVVTTFVAGDLSVGGAPVTPTTQFELGSESKVFTADLLAYLVAAGRISLDDPVQMYVPSPHEVPHYTDPHIIVTTEITIRDLATHQSGLPDLPPNTTAVCGGQGPCDDWRQGYTREMLWEALDQLSLENLPQNLPWQPGTNWLYSNLGFALLGTILADIVSGAPLPDPPAYQTAIDDAFLTDLGMSDTTLEQVGPNLAQPYYPDPAESSGNHTATLWDNTNAFAGGGGLISSADDMATFMVAHLGYLPSTEPLGVRSMATTLRPERDITHRCLSTAPPYGCADDVFRMGLGWELHGAPDFGVGVPWAFKDGGTNGGTTDTALAPGERTGVSTMLNQKTSDMVESLAVKILALIMADRLTPTRPAGGGALADSGLGTSELAVPVSIGGMLVAAGLMLTVRRRAAERPSRSVRPG